MSNITLILHTTDYRGDHSAEIREIITVDSTMRIGELFRMFPKINSNETKKEGHPDWIEIPYQAYSEVCDD
jgi:hypothetical protein